MSASLPDGIPPPSPLFTDLYEFTMAQAYLAEGMVETAVFELAFRKMPAERNYLIAAGLDDVLAFLERWRVTEDEAAYLRGMGKFSEAFLARLKDSRFSGNVFAMPEGTVVFPGEPLVQVEAPIFEAQLAETLVLNQIHFQTLAASKAARVVIAAEGRTVVDFGSRRAHGVDAALKVARTSYLAGAAGSALVLAGKVYGIPLFGTMAHSYIQAHSDEAGAFELFARLYPGTTLLVDTYDTLAGVRKIVDLRQKLGESFQVQGIRLDSGDFATLSRQARKILDGAGMNAVRIFASTALDEHEVARLVARGAPIDGFGVGTKLAVAEDAPSLDMAYKLVEYAGRGRIKLSPRKIVYPHRKQVFRVLSEGKMRRDVVGRFDEKLEGEPLLHCAMRAGVRLPAGRVTLQEARAQASRELQRLPESLRGLARAAPFPVEYSQRLRADLEALRASVG